MRTLSVVLPKFLIMTFSATVFLFFSISCMSVSSLKQNNHTKVYTTIPYKSFVRVHTMHKIIAKGCEDSTPECEKIVKALPIIERPGIGSGTIIETKKGRVILTAAHVCLSPELKQTKYKNHSINLDNTTEIEVSFFKTKKIKAKIEKIDKEKDLCLLTSDITPYPGINIATYAPNIGAPVYVVSAPFNVQGPTLNLIFSGFYSGFNQGFHYYTVTTRPGSSGSVVMNQKFQAIGTLNVAITHLENVGLGEGHKSIKDFVGSF